LTDDSAEKSFSLDLPDNAHPAARVLRIEASPSTAATLFGALDYLTSYPYGCTEQTMSSFLPNVIVTQALKEVKIASIRGATDLASKAQRGMDRLYSFQHDDGGWGWWKDDKTDPFMTAYVVDGLIMAGRAGYKVERGRVDRGRVKLSEMIAAGKTEEGRTIDAETRAFMIYALTESGETDASLVNDLFAKRGELQPYGRDRRFRKEQRHRRTLGVEAKSDARLFRRQYDRGDRPLLEGTGADRPAEPATAEGGALARIQSTKRSLLGFDKTDCVRRSRSD
jgi:hypothetical protein